MKVFISWSGQVSKDIAVCLRDILPLALMRVKFWMSATDMAPGSQWSTEIRRNLSESTVGIVCVTPENLHSSWIYYESGALSHAVGTNLVIPYLHNISISDLPGPLALFQAVQADEEGTKRLFQSINNAAGGDCLNDQELEISFSTWWPNIKTRLEKVHQTRREEQRSDRELLEELLELARQDTSRKGDGTQKLAMNMLHELSLALVTMGLHTQSMKEMLLEAQKNTNPEIKSHDLFSKSEEILNENNLIYGQARIGLYIVRNFLSQISDSKRYEAINAKFEKVDVGSVLEEMVKLLSPLAEAKGISIELSEVNKLPEMQGSVMEINRLFYNVLNNAITYSYHSIQGVRRVIKIRGQVPYDPGFRKPRFSITVENYGLGIEDEEMPDIFRAGFRGKQAMAEVTMGSGLGLSEALKIMKFHKGEIKVQSQELYDTESVKTYLTKVKLIFPYGKDS